MAGALAGTERFEQRVVISGIGRVGYGAARAMWARTDLGPDDVDVAQLYDGFTIECVWWLEALGFCGTGEAGARQVAGAEVAALGNVGGYEAGAAVLTRW